MDEKPVGVIAVKRARTTLSDVQVQAEKYSTGLPDELSPPIRPLPFLYSSTGSETLCPERTGPEAPHSPGLLLPPSRDARRMACAETPSEWVEGWRSRDEMEKRGMGPSRPGTLRSCLRAMPDVVIPGLWQNKVEGITRLEKSPYDSRPRALIQMATESGKTKLAITSTYPLIKHAGVRRDSPSH